VTTTSTTTPPAASAIAPATSPTATPATTGALRATLVNTKASLTIYAFPGGDTQTSLPPTTSYGSARTLLVAKVEGAWVQVYLPERPNGATGWVKGADVRTERVDDAIAVNLKAHTITVTLRGSKPVTAPAAVGTAADPTPTGLFYVTDRVTPNNAAYGSFAIGLSAHSNVLLKFGTGDGQTGIHGTDEPSSIGKSASHGCIRVPDSVVALLQKVPLGTPVTIS
jgi:L,D-transpeptidase catalytic domain